MDSFLIPQTEPRVSTTPKKPRLRKTAALEKTTEPAMQTSKRERKKTDFFLPIPDVQKKRAKRNLIAKTEPSRTRNTTLNSSDGNNDYGVTSDPDHVDEDVACEETAAK
jgi:hypothetical protein